jgi:prepilin-type N-terminal cleavage/methylation domain-containing protein
MKNFKQGFTIIELLVVVAIIGILSSVVLAVLSSAKNKGIDAAVKTNLHTIINQAALFYVDNNNTYLPLGSSTAFGIDTCPTYDIAGTNMFSKNKFIADAVKEATLRGGGNSCYNSASVWAVAVDLKVTADTSWCIDNTGANKQTAFTADSAIDTTTFTCK